MFAGLACGLPCRTAGEWRNWQTRRLQVPVSERMWGFKSPLAHQQAEAAEGEIRHVFDLTRLVAETATCDAPRRHGAPDPVWVLSAGDALRHTAPQGWGVAMPGRRMI